jgi:hypothetical protein
MGKIVKEKEYVNIRIERPRRNEEGVFYYSEVIPFLAILAFKKIPNYKILFGLASYAIQHEGLTKKQQKIADEFIDYFEEIGAL